MTTEAVSKVAVTAVALSNVAVSMAVSRSRTAVSRSRLAESRANGRTSGRANEGWQSPKAGWQSSEAGWQSSAGASRQTSQRARGTLRWNLPTLTPVASLIIVPNHIFTKNSRHLLSPFSFFPNCLGTSLGRHREHPSRIQLMDLTGKRLSLGFDLHHCRNISWTLVRCC